MNCDKKPAVFETAPSFRGLIGVSRRDMTPEPGIYCRLWGSARHDIADTIHRPLYVDAIALKSAGDQNPFIIAILDYSWFARFETVGRLRRPILDALGIPEDRFLLALTHSHSVPQMDEELEIKPGGDKIPAFRAKLISALHQAVHEAVAKLAPGVMSWTRGDASLARKRDFIHPESGQILCGPNPSGVPDTTLMVGRVTSEASGDIVATIVNYACHPVSLGGGNKAVSPDYVGAMREVVEGNTGGAPCMFLHGPSGDQTPRDSYASDPCVADRNGEVLGFAALSALRGMLPPARRLEFIRVESSGAQLAIWEPRAYPIDQLAASSVNYVQLPAKHLPTIAQIEARIPLATDPPTLTRLTRLRDFVTNLRGGLGEGFPIWGMRFGQAIIIATPAEPFTDLQIELRKRFTDNAILVVNDTNGSFNYLPPATYYGNGAYEQDCADFGPGALEIVIASATKVVESLLRVTESASAVAPIAKTLAGVYTW
jgi:hypothetical protein